MYSLGMMSTLKKQRHPHAHGMNGFRTAFIGLALLAAAACCPAGTQPVAPALVRVRLLDAHGNITGVTNMQKIVKSDAEWRKQLTKEQYEVARGKGTERPFCGLFTATKQTGVYACVCCGLPLFSSNHKFHSGTGWPSFFQPVAAENVVEQTDHSLGMARTEILCARCDAHLGHVFPDGPPPTGRRYCVNSASLTFQELPATSQLQRAVFAAGCFWGVEAAFRMLKGVTDVRSGYTGGTMPNPTYEDVCRNTSGHAEAVEVLYNPALVSYEKLLARFWKIHDPTTLNRQGPDVGTQYRSAIFFVTPEQERAARAAKQALETSKKFSRPIVTEIKPAGTFYPAEDYHQQYFEKHPGRACHIIPPDEE